MEIYQLRAFVTTARLGNVTRTAEALHLTQPAITAQLKALEEALGVALFERKAGRINLTRAGERLLPMAKQVLAGAAQLQGAARELQGEVTGEMTLGTVRDADSLRLGSLLGGLVRNLPLLDIKTRHGLADELLEQVAAGVLQGAFYIGPHMPVGVGGLPLQTLYFRIAAPAAMRAAILDAGWRDLAAMPWIGAPARHHLQGLLREAFARHGVAPHIVVESDEPGLPQNLVSSGVGLSLLREDVALAAAERGEAVIWPHVRIGAQLGFIYPAAAEHDPAMVATLSVLRAVWGVG